MPYRVMHVWMWTKPHNRARECTQQSTHATIAEAFAEIDRMASLLVEKGSASDALDLLVLDDQDRIVARPGTH